MRKPTHGRLLPLFCTVAAFLASDSALIANEKQALARERTLSLSGNDWRICEDANGQGKDRRMFDADVSAANWIPATVPGNIQADLEAAHLLKPLWYGIGDPRLEDVAHKDWWYRKDFSVPKSFDGKRVALVFDGVDFECEAWLNGRQIGTSAGMFRRFQFDVADVLHAGQPNRLAVRIARMPQELTAFYSRAKENGVYDGSFWDGINKTRQLLKDLKSPTNSGWDWGINIWTLGIWKDVRLVATGPARIDDVRVRTSLNADFSKAIVAVALEVDSLDVRAGRTRFRIAGNGQECTAFQDVSLAKGRNVLKAEIPLDKPALWWPSGQGPQPLYTLEATIEPAEGGAAIDARSTRFGVRDVRWVHTENAPANFVSRFQLVMNGRPVRTMGSNLIPPDLLFGRAGPRSLQLLRRAKAAGMNTIRQWGGGVVLNDAFYDLADELGIMLSFEFPLANTWPETDAKFLGNLETTLRNILRQVRNHPSIIEYTGGNEMPWNSLTRHPALQLLQKVAAEEGDCLFRATCADLGATHGPYEFKSAETYRHYNTVETMRCGEFGTCSPANLEVWHRDIPPKSQAAVGRFDDPVLVHKNVVQGAFGQQDWLYKPRIDDAFGDLKDIALLVEAGQFLGAEQMRYAMDALRRKGKRIGGFTNWDFNEPWTNGAGSYMVDYDGRPLMVYDFVGQALAPVSLSLCYDSMLYLSEKGVQAELFLTSDAPQSVAGLRWKWLARDRRGTAFLHGEGTASVEPRETKSLAKLDLKLPASTANGPVFVELRLEGSSGKTLAERIHVFGMAGVKAPLAGLLNDVCTANEPKADHREAENEGNTLAGWFTIQANINNNREADISAPVRRTTLVASASPMRVEGDQEVLELLVKNNGAMTALFCEPHPLIEYRTDLFVDNNHCFIPPGESRTITIKAANNSGLSLAQTGWRVSCWNADDAVIEPSADVLLAVGRKDAMCREFLGSPDPSKLPKDSETTLLGTRPAPAALPCLLAGKSAARLKFHVDAQQAAGSALLRLHTADQAANVATEVQVLVNGRRFEISLPKGLGIQQSDAAHLAFPFSAELTLPPGIFAAGENTVECRVAGTGWFTWDAMDIRAYGNGR